MSLYKENKSTRCTQCKKKLGLLIYTCRCERPFCISHLPAEEHACTYDYREEEKKVIQAKMDSEPRASSFERIK